MSEIKSDYLVIGSGIAGLTFALEVAEHGEVSLITKSTLDNTNTTLAQGGVAAVMLNEDSPEDHSRDTHIAGAGLCHKDAVDVMVNEESERIHDLAKRGVEFDKKSNGNYDLAREGGHSFHRVLHVADQTGLSIQKTLIERINEHPRIHVYEHHMAVELITDHHVLSNLQSAFNRPVMSIFFIPITHCWRQAELPEFTYIPQIRASQPGTVLQWHIAQGSESLIWNLFSSIPLRFMNLVRNLFLLQKPVADWGVF